MMAKVIWKVMNTELGDGGRERVRAVERHSLEHELRHAAEIALHAAAVGEGQRIADTIHATVTMQVMAKHCMTMLSTFFFRTMPP